MRSAMMFLVVVALTATAQDKPKPTKQKAVVDSVVVLNRSAMEAQLANYKERRERLRVEYISQDGLLMGAIQQLEMQLAPDTTQKR